MARACGRGRLRRSVDRDGHAVYVADYVDGTGKRRRVQLAGDRATAERVLAKIIRERDLERAGLGSEKGLDLAVADLVAQYLADLRTRGKPRTIANTESILARMVDRMALVRVRDITKARVAAWRLARIADGVSHKTINTELGCLAAALNLAVRMDQLPTNPLAGLRALPTTAAHRRRQARALTETEIGRLLRVAAEDDARDRNPIPREPLLRALIGTGARWHELVSTTWADLDAGLGVLELRGETTKTQRGRRIPLDSSVLDGIEVLRRAFVAHFLREPRREERIFLSPRAQPWTRDTSNWRRWQDAMLDAACIERRDHSGRVVHVHALRHTFATRLARAGVPIAAAAALTGHRSAQILLEVYQHVSVEDAREAIRSLPALPVAPSLREVADGSSGR